MKVTKHNCEQVAKWLLQCNHEDFNGPIDTIAEYYLELENVYQERVAAKRQSGDYLDSGTLQITLLTRTLYEHLNKQAKTMLQTRIALLD